MTSICSGHMNLYQVWSCPSHAQEMSSISIVTEFFKILMVSPVSQMLREHKLMLILMLHDDGFKFYRSHSLQNK